MSEAHNITKAASSDIARALVEQGYSPLPIRPGTKACKVERWQRWCIDFATDAELATFPADHGVGIAGRKVVAIDIDLLDADEADRLEVLAREMLGETPLRRVGRAPKRLLVYRTDERIAVAGGQGLDILGFGHQFVAFAIHPGTGRPYEWGERTPLNTPVSELPLVTSAQIEAFVAAADLPARDAGGGGQMPALVHDIKTGLIIDGRGGWLTRCVWQAAADQPDAMPEAWAGDAWDHFQTTTDLARKSEHDLTERAALRKAKALHKKIAAGRAKLPDANLIGDGDPPVVARAFQPELGDGGFWRGDFYRWTGSGWKVMDTDQVTGRFYRWLEGKRFAKKAPRITRSFVSDVLAALAGLTGLGSDDAPFWVERREDDPEPSALLPFRNGLLNVATGVLAPHERRLFTLHRVECDFDPEATSPTYDQFLEQVLPNDFQSRQTLDEFFGYCLTADTRQQKALMLIGQKRSGRGTLLRLLRTVVGPTLAPRQRWPSSANSSGVKVSSASRSPC